MKKIKMLLLHELSVFVTDENLVDEEAVNSNDPTRITIVNEVSRMNVIFIIERMTAII
jgi:hypothetical protein